VLNLHNKHFFLGKTVVSTRERLRDIELRPRESYRVAVPLRSPHPKTICLDTVVLQVGDTQGDHPVLLPAKQLRILPAIGREITVEVEPLCSYERGTKVQLTFVHRGQTLFTDLVISLGPAEALQAGKPKLCRSSFAPNDEEQMEAVIAGESLEIGLEAMAGNVRTEARLSRPISGVLSRADRPRFRFLEPRRLSLDQKAVYQVSGTELRPVEPVNGAYPLASGEQYQVLISPQDATVTEVTLRDITGVVQVRKTETEADQQSWRFLIAVSSNELFSKPERLFYDVIRGGQKMTGELPLLLRPAWGKHFRLACALGIALTLQGLTVLGRFLVRADFSLEEAFAHFHLGSDYQVLFPLCIPLVWGIIRLWDWIHYQLQS
jgi:hypothetical protein